ncbi:MAG: histidine triad nucleotide-binding protein [Planctomycetes bacterium]|nr:histidine triad nucleotide-binding protein [Planctomycetota bacterium]
MKDCVFCRIARREIPAKIVSETDRILAFRDLNPQAPTHVLLVPKEHVASVNDLAPAHAGLVGELVLAAREIAAAEGVSESGYRLVLNVGAGAGQSVFHVHLHLLGGRNFGWPPG